MSKLPDGAKSSTYLQKASFRMSVKVKALSFDRDLRSKA